MTLSSGELHERFLSWRGIDLGHECPRCNGAGRTTYGSTATWRGGIGGAAMTMDVCDRCWGSGDRHRPGADLTKLTAAAKFGRVCEADHERMHWLEKQRPDDGSESLRRAIDRKMEAEKVKP
jgi:hypothetical protein